MVRSVVAALALGYVGVASAFMSVPLATTPKLRSATTGASTICMGRKGAQTGQGKGAAARTVTREKKVGGVAIISVRKTKDDVSRASIYKALETVTSANFAEVILNPKVEKYIKEEAGSSVYPRMMRQIKFQAKKVGATVPDRWCYEAAATSKARAGIEAKAAAKVLADAAAAEEAAAAKEAAAAAEAAAKEAAAAAAAAPVAEAAPAAE
mmetsp:Transcript_65067/g.95265  ORF Transcript_65067/g.95265 Transcript_65067/m.95265 type:complete len:210 (+) Transcript_65067:22-651(+)|eukprot:CAMPEP_0179441782 /NCGR_PEP_ID=MMETSP0799-20121207/25284_1 /TAXON_ID=46947 /ORGANISM="Geminigera cryophila, Strain CCMP2564" /LENGTH=209 /DNA_ID=CAMNT_0021226281 /DNA_START=19 /DNA_END=648 /DNA_ORIENTATION=+